MPRSGLSYSSLLGWMFAAVWANYRPTDFLELSGEMQSFIFAAYETHIQIEAVLAEEEQKKSKRTSSGNSKMRRYR